MIMSIISYHIVLHGAVWTSLNIDGEVPSTRRAYGDGFYWTWGIINDPMGILNKFIVSHHDVQLANQSIVSK